MRNGTINRNDTMINNEARTSSEKEQDEKRYDELVGSIKL